MLEQKKKKNTMRKSEQRCYHSGSEKMALSWKMARFRHKPDINPVIRGKSTNMWPLLNNIREFSVLKK